MLRNETRGLILAQRPARARGFLARGLGLMGRPSLPPGEALILDPCGSIHMFGMRFPIDALFLDRQGCCLAVARHLRPWRLGPFVRGARCVIELPAGTARETEVGDRILWEV